MAIEHISTVACDTLIRSIDGKVSLIGVFRNIAALQMPATKLMGIVVEFIGEQGDPFSVTLESDRFPEPMVLAEGNFTSTPRVNEFSQHGAMVTGEANLTFTEPGVFYVTLQSGDRIVHRTTFGAFIDPNTEGMENV